MANAKLCDRCGDFYGEMLSKDPDIYRYNLREKVAENVYKTPDLCPSCAGKLTLFMAGMDDLTLDILPVEHVGGTEKSEKSPVKNAEKV